MRYNVYKIDSKGCYTNYSLVSAESAEEANEYIYTFKGKDKNDENDAWGYEEVDENDIIPNLYSDIKGIIYYGIYYRG